MSADAAQEEFTVTWTRRIVAASPIVAAKEALQLHRDADPGAAVFYVERMVPRKSVLTSVMVDLSDETPIVTPIAWA